MATKEEIYDDNISPLMTQILTICKEHKIAMIADFALNETDFHCTSALLTDEFNPLPNQMKAWEVLKPQSYASLAETVETLPDGTKRITITRIS